MELHLLSFLASIIALVTSLVTLVRARKYQEVATLHSQYVISPKLSLGNIDLYIFDDKYDKPAFEISGELKCHSSTAVKIIGAYIEYGSEYEPEKRFKQKIFGPAYISENEIKAIKASGTSWHTERASSEFELPDVHFWVTIEVQGIDGLEMITRYFLCHQNIATKNVLTRCPPKEVALEP